MKIMSYIGQEFLQKISLTVIFHVSALRARELGSGCVVWCGPFLVERVSYICRSLTGGKGVVGPAHVWFDKTECLLTYIL